MYIKESIDVLDHLSDIMKSLKKGVLLTTKHDGKVNAMTISWGQVGIEWGKLLFTVFVRTGRHTCKMLEQSGEFAININPKGDVGHIIGFCGVKSGKEVDKIAALDLKPIPGNRIDVPCFSEMPLTLECKVVYHRVQNEKIIPEELKSIYYPQDVGSGHHGDNKDLHMVFLGEIVDAYIIREKH